MIDRLSAALGRIAPSATLAMSGRVIDLKSQGIDVIGLSAGEPDFDTPDFVKDAAIEAIRSGQTKYTAVDGIAPLKAAIGAKLLPFFLAAAIALSALALRCATGT